MEPAAAYRRDLKQHAFVADPAQERAVDALQSLFDQVNADYNRQASLLHRFKRLLAGADHKRLKGLYLWGDVGRGKTWLMNLFYDSLPFDDKLRLHFHHFMIAVHEKLAGLNMVRNPLEHIAREFAGKYRVLCLDEFIVTNITDAMLLYGLLEALFKNGVTLVATSNRVPDDLYKNGLQRDRFVPAIKLIKEHTEVLHIDGDTDHRIALLEQENVYYSPITPDTVNKLAERMQALAPGAIRRDLVLSIHKRPVTAYMHADEIAWFEFDVLCNTPRATPDYIELAREYHTIILSGVPVMDENNDDKARRFIYLIDELYDRSVKLIISADAKPEKLYTGEMLKFAFNRTSSRLVEMRSRTYLEQPHR